MQTKKINLEHEHFNKLSNEWWDENGKFKVLHQIRPIRLSYILSQINSTNIKNLDFLDLGCGGGLISESISRLGGNVTGIDFVKKNIEIAKHHSIKKKLKINYLNADIENFNLENKFDVIILFEVLEHLNDWKSFLLKIKKNLKKNGIIVISTINRNLISKYTAIFIAENILKWIPKGTHQYKKFIKPQEIKKCVVNKNIRFGNLKGLVFNPIEKNWKLSNNTTINYFCTLKLLN